MKKNRIILTISIFIIVINFFLFCLEFTQAKSVMWTKNESNMLYYFADRWGCCGWTEALGTRMISVKYNAEIKNLSKNSEVVADNSEVAIGSKLRFIFTPHQSEDIYWFGTGYTQDSPYGDWVEYANERSSGSIVGTRWVSCTPVNSFDTYCVLNNVFQDPHYGEYGTYENIYAADCDEKDLVQSGVYSYEAGRTYGPYDIYIPLSIDPPDSKTLTNITGMTCGAKQGNELTGFYYDCTVNSLGALSPKFNIGSTYGKFYYKYWDYRDDGSKEAGCYRTDYPLSSVDGGGSSSGGTTYNLQVPAQTINYTLRSREPLPPTAPIITGPTRGYVGKGYSFSIKATHPDGINIKYGFDWDKNGVVDEWTPSSGYVTSGVSKTVSKTWDNAGVIKFQALVVDSSNKTSSWTEYTFEVLNLPVATISIDPNIVMDGGAANIKWSSTDSSYCLASGSWKGSVSTSTGEHSTSTGILDITTITKTYTYTIKCSGLLETSKTSPSVYDIKSATVAVSSYSPVVTLSANPAEIKDINSSSTISWNSFYTDVNSCSKTMASGTDSVWTAYPSTGKPVSGSASTQKFVKNGIYVYKVTCKGNTVDVFATTSVKVNIGSSLKLTAEPSQITTSNSSSTLVWVSNGIINDSCSKTMVSGTDSTWLGSSKPSFGTSTTQKYISNGQYIYKIECSTPSGSKLISTTTVNVNVPKPTVSLVANPSSVGRTSSSTLVWSSTDVTNNTCVKTMVAKTDSTWFGSTNPFSGSQSTRKYGTLLTSNLYDGDYIYKISCTGPGGVASTTATVTVGQYPPPSVIIDGPNSVEPGTNPVITWTASNSTSCVKTSGNGSWAGSVNNISTSPYQVTELPGSINNTTTYIINCTGLNGNTGNVSKTVTVTQCTQDNWSCTDWSPNPCIVGQIQSRICTNNIVNQCPSNIVPTPEVSRVCSNTVSIFYPLCQAYQDYGRGTEVSTGTIFVNRDMQWRASNIPSGSYYMTSNFGDNNMVTVSDYLTFYKFYQNPGIKNFSISLESLDGTSRGVCATSTNAIVGRQIDIEE